MGRPLGSGNKNEPAEIIVEVLPTLDRDKPYAEVCGLPGAFYEQNNHFFSKEGHYVRPEDTHPVNDDPDPPQPEEYHGYNQVTLQESPKPTFAQSKEIARHIIYGDGA